MRGSGATLEVRGLRKSFGAVHALGGVDLSIGAGELCGLIGPNGSGKSTLFDCCTGMTVPDSGSVLIDGTDVSGWSQHRIALHGRLRRSFQRNVVLGSMSVFENLLLAGQAQAIQGIPAAFMNRAGARAAMREVEVRADELLRLVELERLRDAMASELSVGQQKLLQFAATMMPAPRLVLLDEPFAGVNPVLIERLVHSIQWANTELGATIVVIEHNVEELFSLCRRVIVMSAGERIADGTPAQVAVDQRVVGAYLGV